VKPITCNFLDRDPQCYGNRQTDISVYIPRQRLGNVSCKMCEIVHMQLTPQRCGNRQTEGNREYERGCDYLDSHVLTDPSVMTRDHALTPRSCNTYMVPPLMKACTEKTRKNERESENKL
jgi:hypothetical protein